MTLRALDFDPFADDGPKLRPLDFDPFADETPGREPSTMAGFEPPEPSNMPGGPVPESGEFSKGFQTGVTGAKQMGVAAATIPLAAVTRNTLKVFEGFDAVDRGEPIPRDPIIGTHGDYNYGQIARYQAATPEQRASMRERAERMLAETGESKAELVLAWKQYQEEMKATRGRVPDATDIGSLRDFSDWFAFNFGQGLPYIGATIAAGLAGGMPAVIGTGFAMGAGDIQSEMIEKGMMDEGASASLLGAVPYAALEFLGPAGRLFRGVGRKAMQEVAEGYFKRAGKAVPKNAVEEFLNEAGQEIVKDATVSTQTGEKLVTDESLKRWFNAGAAGAASGAPIGAVKAAGGRGPSQPPAPPPAPDPILTPEDRASPIPDDLIAAGKRTIAAATGEPVPPPVEAPPAPPAEALPQQVASARPASAIPLYDDEDAARQVGWVD
ncbi:MAG: hypothetical protein FJX63_09750, partial [Alphaproteobacteria bacterium]|nr:hypothetical protein [Alphaproteobacteria bacterium]